MSIGTIGRAALVVVLAVFIAGAKETQKFDFTANYTGRIFSEGIDHWLKLGSSYRINKHFTVGAETGINILGSGFLAGCFGHYFLRGNLNRDFSEDFLHFGLGYIEANKGFLPSFNKNLSPLFALGLGRDMLLWENASFALEVLAKLEYAPLNRVFFRKSDEPFGLTSLAKFAFALEIGIMF